MRLRLFAARGALRGCLLVCHVCSRLGRPKAPRRSSVKLQGVEMPRRALSASSPCSMTNEFTSCPSGIFTVRADET